MAARLKEKYYSEILPAMQEEFKYDNIMQAPKLEKIIVNVGVGDATQDPRLLDAAVEELTLIVGQKPAIRKAKKSIANFKLREDMPIACMATLRGERMYEFLDRLTSVAIPRIRDFRGVSDTAFDRFGNYTLGLKEQTIFTEINMDNVSRVRGMNITIVIKNGRSAKESQSLLAKFGMPFRKRN